MKKQILPFLSLLFALQIAAGQNHKFAGIVSWYMSTEPVVGVEVSSIGTGINDFTNDKGYFELTFPNKDPGDRIRLSVGKMDGAENRLEVVNGEILEYLFLPNSPDDLHLQIVVGKPGQFQEVVNNNYKSLSEHSQRRLVEDSVKIQEKIDVPTQSLEEVQRLKAELKTLKERHRSAKSQLEEMSIQIALINRDTASEVVKQALANIDKGENIEKALVTLFNEDLDGAYDKAFRQKRRAEGEIQRIVEKLEMEAHSRMGDSLFTDAADKYERICRIYEENRLDKKTLADQQRSAGQAWFEAGEFDNAAKFYLKSITTKELELGRDHPSLASNYAEIATTHYYRKNYSGALDAYQRCIDIVAKHEGTASSGLIFPYDGMALAHKTNGNLKEAEAWFIKVVDLIEKKTDVSLNDRLGAFTNLVNFYVETGNPSKAQSGYKKIISLLESDGPASSALLGDYLLKIAHTQQFNHEYDEAIKSLLYAIDLYEKALPAEHPKIGDAQRMLAFVRRSKGFYLFSEKKYQEALAVFNEIAPGSDDDEVFNQRGVCHYLLRNYDQALEDYKHSAELNPIRKETDYYSQIGLAYLKKREDKKAKDAFEDFEKKDPSNPLVWRNKASYYAVVKKDKKDAMEALQKAVKMGFHDLDWLRSESSLDGLRGEVAFQQLVKEVEQSGQGKK